MKKYLLSSLCIIWCFAGMAQSKGAATFYDDNYSSILTVTNYGKIIKKSTPNTPPKAAGAMGSDYVHIFMDEYGNLISDNLPNGVPWIRYVVHVIHPGSDDASFGIVQTSGSISGSFVVQNSSSAAGEKIKGEQGKSGPAYTEDISVLNPSDNSNIGFQVIKTVADKSGTATKNTIATYTITMSGFYNASIDVGIFSSRLHNPTYTLVNSPSVAGSMVVKAAGGGDRTMTTIMGTIYFSPVVWIERLINKDDVPLFKVKGRSSIADHTLLERFYPTVGLSINDNSFQNIFYGINWELIRGGSLFLGFHTGKINTYNSTTPGFAFGSTAVTQDQFNYNTDTKWATKFAIGATIDLKVVLGLLSTQVK